MSGVDWLGYIEEITSFDFRVEDGITIPKEVRERAFSLQVDVEIVSTIGNDYVNNKSAPAFGFYGYAVLVFRDHSEIQIPINQPRQRLYFGRIPDAFVGWKRLHSERESRLLHNELIVALGTIWGALGLEDYSIEARQCPVWEGFEELPLREVYVKTRFGTQFRIEVSRWVPIIRTGDPDGCNYDGKSNQVDGSKDDGLPPNGSQPQKADDPLNPYAGLPPVTPDSVQGAFSNSKLANLDNSNPLNESKKYGGILYTAIAPEPSCQQFRVEQWFLLEDENTLTTSLIRSLNPVCGGIVVRVIELSIQDGAVLLPEVFALDGYSISYFNGLERPPDVFEPL